MNKTFITIAVGCQFNTIEYNELTFLGKESEPNSNVHALALGKPNFKLHSFETASGKKLASVSAHVFHTETGRSFKTTVEMILKHKETQALFAGKWDTAAISIRDADSLTHEPPEKVKVIEEVISEIIEKEKLQTVV